MFGNIEVEHLLTTYSKVNHQMGCEYIEMSALEDKGHIDHSFLVLLDVIEQYREWLKREKKTFVQ